ncbi:hypothetical protein NQ314_000129 [Rhamnusium bicolor]|uniref:Uncharacterized protein n=1 Tax=Rhamnusium bicolor TaxID=1586634 RepID=A0AAV8ZZ44_9CUCU|nr:hypothetical protein NQ314_000129 [Rhamnusium bicolor]
MSHLRRTRTQKKIATLWNARTNCVTSLYCKECWIDMGSVCLACQTENEDMSSGIDEDEEFGH